MEKRTALVTGANRGIGLEVARGLAADGLNVLLGCRNLEYGKEAASTIEGEVFPVELDLLKADEMQSQLKEILSDQPQIDVLVNNAGILAEGSFLEVSRDKFLESVRVNFEAPFDLIRTLVPGMIERGYGRIVNVTSGWGSFSEGLAGPTAYSTTKAALNALTVSLSQSLPECIKVNSVCPGWVQTRMGGDQAPRSPKEGAETIIWLATLPADGPAGRFFRDKTQIAW